MRTRRFHTALVAAIAAALTSGCVGRAGGDADARIPKAVRLMAVEASKGVEPTTYSAIIAPNAQVDLAFRVSGYVVDVRQTKGADGRIRALEPGAAVTTGLVLARIRTTDYQAGVDKAQGSRNELTASVTAAESELVEAKAALTQAEADFGRIETLWQQESVTKPVYDASKARLDAARARVDAATASVAAAQQRANAAAAQLEEARIALGDTELRTPFNGVLVERRVEIGTLVSPGMPAFTVADLQQVKVRFGVPDTALDLFRTGRPLPVSVDAYPNERFEGHVLSVAPAADPKSRSFEIIVAIDNPTLKLRSGMIASIEVRNDATDHRQVRIPIDALVHDPTRDRYVVYTVAPKDGATGTVKAIEVRPGPLVGNQVSILEGLSVGQRIVASGANMLQPGDVVKELQ
jgi:membrane fusion protein, multidrug efflux system